MNPTTLRLFDRLDIQLRRLLSDARFADSLIGAKPSKTLEVDGEDMALVVGRLVQQIQTARNIAQRLFEAAGDKQRAVRQRR